MAQRANRTEAPASEPEEEEEAGFTPRWRQGRAALAEGLAIVLWGVLSFLLTFVELVCEILAPIALFAGGLWWAALRIAGSLPAEPEIRQFLAYLPNQLVLSGHLLTPERLMLQALVLLAVVAACRTVNGIIAREA